jgi:hypothetical protein
MVEEKLISIDEYYSNFQIILNESTYVSNQIYVILFTPESFMDFEGFSPPFKIKMVSSF